MIQEERSDIKTTSSPLQDHSAETFKPLWAIVGAWQYYFYVTDGWSIYPGFIPPGDQIVSKTYMTRVEGENTRLPHYLARLHRKTLCYSKSEEMLALLIALRALIKPSYFLRAARSAALKK